MDKSKTDKKVELLELAAVDSRLNHEAVGLLTMLVLSKAALELATNPPELAKHIGVGQTKVYTLLRALQDTGYIQKERVRDAHGRLHGNRLEISYL